MSECSNVVIPEVVQPVIPEVVRLSQKSEQLVGPPQIVWFYRLTARRILWRPDDLLGLLGQSVVIGNPVLDVNGWVPDNDRLS